MLRFVQPVKRLLMRQLNRWKMLRLKWSAKDSPENITCIQAFFGQMSHRTNKAILSLPNALFRPKILIKVKVPFDQMKVVSKKVAVPKKMQLFSTIIETLISYTGSKKV